MKSILRINKGLSRIISTMVLGYVVLLGGSQYVTHAASIAPYPASSVIQKINWDFSNLIRLAAGSDIWTNTWASDGNVYAGWGGVHILLMLKILLPSAENQVECFQYMVCSMRGLEVGTTIPPMISFSVRHLTLIL